MRREAVAGAGRGSGGSDLPPDPPERLGEVARAAGPPTSSRSPVIGWSKASLQAWRNGRVRPRARASSPPPPYLRSPRTGCPIAERWTRIWWVRPGPGRGLEERGAAEPLADLEPRRGLPPAGRVHADPRARAPERRVDLEPIVGHRTSDQREVAPVGFVPAEQSLQRRVGLVVGRDHEQPGGPRIETVHDPRSQRPAAASERDVHPEEPVDHRARAPVLGGMRGQPGGLADHGQVRIPPRELERRALGRELPRRLQVHLDHLAAREPMGLRPDHAVHPNAAGGDRPLHVRTGDAEPRRRPRRPDVPGRPRSARSRGRVVGRRAGGVPGSRTAGPPGSFAPRAHPGRRCSRRPGRSRPRRSRCRRC